MYKKFRKKRNKMFSSLLAFLLCFSMLVEPVMATESGITPAPTPEATEGDILKDAGDFENIDYEISTTTAWRWHGSYTGKATVVDDANKMSPAKGKYLQIKGDGNNKPVIKWGDYSQEVDGNKTYKLDMYLRRRSNHWPYIVLQEQNANENRTKIISLYTADGKTDLSNNILSIGNKDIDIWQQITYEFTTSADAEYLGFFVYGNNKSVAFDIDGISILKLVASVTVGESTVNYTTLQEAVAAATEAAASATEDVVITLLDDIVYAGDLPIGEKITLDLNGNTLTASSLATFDGNVVDNSDDKSGILKVDSTKCVFSKTNSQMPVYDDTNEGYVFATITPQELNKSVAGIDAFELVFKPLFGTTINDLLSDSSVDTKISFRIRLDWKEDGTSVTPVYLEYTDEMVQQVYGNGMAFSIKASGVSNYEGLTITPLIISDQGAEWTNGSFSNFE